MEKIFHWTNTFKTLGESEDGSVDIKGLASTNALDRTGAVSYTHLRAHET